METWHGFLFSEKINIYFRLTHTMSSPLFSSKLCHPPPTQTHFFTLVSWISCRMDGWGVEEVRERGKKNLQTLTFDLINWLSPTSGLARCWRRGLLRSLFQVVFRWQGWDFQAECIRKWNRKHGLRQSTWIPRILFLTTRYPLPRPEAETGGVRSFHQTRHLQTGSDLRHDECLRYHSWKKNPHQSAIS